MIKLTDIPLFTGDGSQDAEKWQQDFLLSTAHYGDDAVARLFLSKLASGSPAWKRIDSLPETVKASWFKLERVFRTEWLPNRIIEPPKDDPWDTFESHILTEEMIFGDSPKSNSRTDLQAAIRAWVADHQRLGRYTGGPDDCLVRVTKLLLPIFIRTILSLKPRPQTFIEMCTAIKAIPLEVLEMEKARYREVVRREERLSTMEMKLEEIFERVNNMSGGNSNNRAGKEDKRDKHLATSKSDISQPTLDPQPFPNSSNSSSSSHAIAALIAGQSASKSLPGTKKPSVSKESPMTAGPTKPPNHQVNEPKGRSRNGLTASLLASNPVASKTPKQDENPETWDMRKPEVSPPRDEQLAIARRAIDGMLQYLMGSYVFRGIGDDQWQDVWSSMAIHDKITNSSSNKAKVEEALEKYCSPHVSRSYWLDRSRLLWGISLIHAFRTYGGPKFLQVAQEHWNLINLRLVTPDQSTVRRHINTYLDDIRLHRTSEGDVSLSGGVFKDSFEGTEISAFETTLYMTLSTYLAACTGQQHYTDAAILTANCIKKYMIDSATSVIKDCTVDAWNGKVAENGTVSAFLTGVFLEGLSVLSWVTRDESWCQLASDTASAAMKFPKWHRNGWILSPTAGYPGSEGDVSNSKGNLIRGLRQVYKLDFLSPEVKNSIRRYVNVQYNALLDLARTGDSYGIYWTGSYTEPSAAGQMAALDVFCAAIDINLT